MHTFVSFATGVVVLVGVYAVFAILRTLADFVIFLVALADSFLAANIYEWYPKVSSELTFLPAEFSFKGWAICVIALAVIGALFALPLVPFSSINKPSAPSPNTKT